MHSGARRPPPQSSSSTRTTRRNSRGRQHQGAAMDFGALPPEINSVRMYAGPGSGTMLAAASAWDGLAAQLYAASASYETVIANLSSGWQGPSSVAMGAAAAPYVEWMITSGAQ